MYREGKNPTDENRFLESCDSQDDAIIICMLRVKNTSKGNYRPYARQYSSNSDRSYNPQRNRHYWNIFLVYLRNKLGCFCRLMSYLWALLVRPDLPLSLLAVLRGTVLGRPTIGPHHGRRDRLGGRHGKSNTSTKLWSLWQICRVPPHSGVEDL